MSVEAFSILIKHTSYLIFWRVTHFLVSPKLTVYHCLFHSPTQSTRHLVVGKHCRLSKVRNKACTHFYCVNLVMLKMFLELLNNLGEVSDFDLWEALNLPNAKP